MKTITGFVAITPTICQGDIMAWSTEDDNGNYIPVVCDSKEELQAEIEEEEDTEDYIGEFTQDENGNITVTNEGVIVLSTTLEQWRKDR